MFVLITNVRCIKKYFWKNLYSFTYVIFSRGSNLFVYQNHRKVRLTSFFLVIFLSSYTVVSVLGLEEVIFNEINTAPDNYLECYSVIFPNDIKYNISEEEIFGWELNYYESQGSGISFKEFIFKGKMLANITNVTDQFILGSLDVSVIEGDLSSIEKRGGYLSLFSLASEDLVCIELNVDFTFDSILDVQYDSPSAFIWPINDNYWFEIENKFNLGDSPPLGNRSYECFNGKHLLKEFSDMRPVDGYLTVSSLEINTEKGYLEKLKVESEINGMVGPFSSNLTLTIMDDPLISNYNASSTRTITTTPNWILSLFLLSLLAMLRLKRQQKKS